MSGQNPRGTQHTGLLTGMLATVGAATLALAAPATAQPLEDDETNAPRLVLGGRAALDSGELADGGWSIVTDTTDRLVLVAGATRVRVVVDAVVGPTADPSSANGLLPALAEAPGLTAPRYLERPSGALAVLDVDSSAGGASSCTALPWQVDTANRTTLTGEGDAKVVLGTPCTIERAYVVAQGPGNLLAEAQAPRGPDGGAASMDAADALVLTLVPAGTRGDDAASSLGYVPR
ncbi:hypothetical protein [Promicromonospora sp. NPDC019610]|uniref:hypothetical protein n=1 Tax=Promicromonospora sp. NPDC019610 TaxID=3364405 RepID=UPI0037932138